MNDPKNNKTDTTQNLSSPRTSSTFANLGAIDLNNEAAAQIKNGQIKEAVQILTRAINVAKEVVHSNPHEVTTRSSAFGAANQPVLDRFISLDCTLDERTGRYICCEPAVIPSSSSSCTPTPSSCQDPHEKNEIDFSSPTPSSLDDDITHTEISAIIIFNLAVACHLEGINKDSVISLRKASKLYQAVWRFFGGGTNSGSKLIVLVLANNIAHIHLILERRGATTAEPASNHTNPSSSLQEQEGASLPFLRCMMLLVSLIVDVDASNCHRHGPSDIEKLLRNIFSNIFPGSFQAIPSAPAA